MTRRLALFDFDGTMIAGDSIADFVRFLWKEGFADWSYLRKVIGRTLHWKIGKTKVEEVKSLALSPLKTLENQQIHDLSKRFVQERLVPRIYPKALETMKEHRRAGDVVLLVSASPEVYLRHLNEWLPVDGILGTLVDESFQVTHNLIREEKPRRIISWLESQKIHADFPESFAYGDSANDLPMLRFVGKPHLVNAHKNALRRAPDFPRLQWKKNF